MSLNSIEKLKLMGSTSVDNNAVSQTSNLNAESIFNNSNVINSQSGMFESSAYLEKNATNVFDSSKKTTQNYQEDQDTDTLSLRQELEQTKKGQGIVSKAWDGIKNFFGAKNSSSNVEKTIEKFENGEISEEEARQALDEYKNAQSTFTEKLSGIISTAGLIGTVAGAVLSLIPGGQVIGLPLLAISGKVALGGMFVDNALDLVDNSTDKDGLTKDELKDLAIETGVEAVAYVAGRGIGKLTGNMHTNISNKLIEKGTNKVASKAIGYAGEALADGALSLSADYGIAQTQSLITTGKTVAWKDYWSWDRFKSEGRSQLIGILTGVATSKQYSSGTIAPSATGAKVASDGADVVSTKGVDGDVVQSKQPISNADEIKAAFDAKYKDKKGCYEKYKDNLELIDSKDGKVLCYKINNEEVYEIVGITNQGGSKILKLKDEDGLEFEFYSIKEGAGEKTVKKYIDNEGNKPNNTEEIIKLGPTQIFSFDAIGLKDHVLKFHGFSKDGWFNGCHAAEFWDGLKSYANTTNDPNSLVEYLTSQLSKQSAIVEKDIKIESAKIETANITTTDGSGYTLEITFSNGNSRKISFVEAEEEGEIVAYKQYKQKQDGSYEYLNRKSVCSQTELNDVIEYISNPKNKVVGKKNTNPKVKDLLFMYNGKYYIFGQYGKTVYPITKKDAEQQGYDI